MSYNKPEVKESDYKKVDYIIEKIRSYIAQGFKVFNCYHFRNKDILMIQLKDGKGNSITIKEHCVYPVYKFISRQIEIEKNKFESLYYIDTARCSEQFVKASTLDAIGKLNFSENKPDYYAHFNPERYLVYNVLRPEYYITTHIKKSEQLSYEETRICSIDIEVDAEGGRFPEPSDAKQPVALLTIFDTKNCVANVFCLDDDKYGLDYSEENILSKIKTNMPDLVKLFPDVNIQIKINRFEKEAEMLTTVISFLNENFDIVTGWNVNEFDFAYIINRCKKHLNVSFPFYVVYDGFTYAYVFNNFICFCF